LKASDPIVSSIALPVKTNAAMSYPAHLIKQNTLRDGTALTIRAIRPIDQTTDVEVGQVSWILVRNQQKLSNPNDGPERFIEPNLI
jgi:hypothetical protein